MRASGRAFYSNNPRLATPSDSNAKMTDDLGPHVGQATR